ncbi:hypothetical protein [Mesorhizobium sp. M7A.F.Ca.US.001.04.2.1]|uniref:hypothetical protein n=1 Tax=Mesorhizobium sp. M7A.F.Ca.US.001.04.2.1 TaxID=2496727 RepID=UPI0032AF7F1A
MVLNKKGVSAFHSLRSAMRWAPDRIIFVAFDLLHHDGINLRPAPLLERREKLLELVGPARGVIQYSHHVHGGGLTSTLRLIAWAWRAWCRSGRTACIGQATPKRG